MLQKRSNLILCDHSSATKKLYPNESLDELIKCDECAVSYRITHEANNFYFESGKLSDDQREALLKYIISEYPKLQISGSPAPIPVIVDTILIKRIISRIR